MFPSSFNSKDCIQIVPLWLRHEGMKGGVSRSCANRHRQFWIKILRLSCSTPVFTALSPLCTDTPLSHLKL